MIAGCAPAGLGSVALTWQDLQAWATMTGNWPDRWEVDALIRLGTTFAEVRSKKEKPNG